MSELQIAERLFRLLDRFDDGVEIRPVAGVEFGMEQFAISANLEGAAARGNQRERLDALAEFENFSRQTDGLRRVVSNDAVFDRDFGLHRQTPFRSETSDVIQPVKPRGHPERSEGSRKRSLCDQSAFGRSLPSYLEDAGLPTLLLQHSQVAGSG
jgi:hypothetical protein